MWYMFYWGSCIGHDSVLCKRSYYLKYVIGMVKVTVVFVLG